ncbi:MAG TPA: hypothetical protein VF588_10065 [Pyrinomonadaceae bacterium]|jgi:type IV secretory pathway TrbD component
MTPTAELFNVASLASLFVLGALALRKLVLMDGLLELRVVILTALLWAVLFGLFIMACPARQYDCVVIIY